MEPLEIQIVRQGDPRVNAGNIRVQHDDIVMLEIDMHTKRCDPVHDATLIDQPFPGLTISTTPGTPEIGHTDNLTEIAFPQFAGWHVEMCEISRYTLHVILLPEAKAR